MRTHKGGGDLVEVLRAQNLDHQGKGAVQRADQRMGDVVAVNVIARVSGRASGRARATASTAA